MKPALIAAIMLAEAVGLALRSETAKYRANMTAKAQGNHQVTLSPSIKSEQTESGKQPKENHAPDGNAPSQRALIVITGITALFIMWQAYETRRAATATAKSVAEIEKQTVLLEKQATAARDSADIMRLEAQSAAIDIRRLNRAYLTVDGWTAKNIPASTEGPWRVVIRFSIYNPSRTAARIERLDYKVRGDTYSLPYGIMVMLTPQERHEVQVPMIPITKIDNVVTIQGKITYRDIFRKERHRTFSQSLLCGDSDFVFYRAEMQGMNEEEEWDKDD
jgi:hypothetical protein